MEGSDKNIVTAICACGKMLFDKVYYDTEGNAATKILDKCIHKKQKK